MAIRLKITASTDKGYSKLLATVGDTEKEDIDPDPDNGAAIIERKEGKTTVTIIAENLGEECEEIKIELFDKASPAKKTGKK